MTARTKKARSRKIALHGLDTETRKLLQKRDHYPEDVHDYRVDRESFTIYVGGDPRADSERYGEEPGVEHHMADRFETNMGILSAIDSERPILVNLSSCGGNWDHGMKMFSAILYCPNPVTVLGTYDCRSMTSIIPLAADKFVMRPPAQFMFHHGTAEMADKTIPDIETAYMELKKSTEMMLRIYAARLRMQGIYKGRDEDEIKKILNARMVDRGDVWLSAEEAQKEGFLDDVFEGSWRTLRATEINVERRKLMSAVLRRKLRFEPARVY